MEDHPSPGDTGELIEASRLAGFGDVRRLTLDLVERRRTELLGLSFFMFVAFAVGMVTLSFAPAELFEGFGGVANILRVGVVALAGAFGLYVAEKHRRLRHLTSILVNERVVASALTNRLRQIGLLQHAGRAVATEVDLHRCLHVILASACELLGADEGSVLLLDPGDEEFELVAAYGRTELFLGQRRSASEGVAGYVCRSRESLLIENELDMVELAALVDRPIGRDHRLTSSISAPMEVRGEVVGVISVNVTTGRRSFEEYDRHTLELFADHAAVAVLQDRLLAGTPSGRMGANAVDRARAEMLDRMAVDLARLDEPRSQDDASPATAQERRLKVLVVDDDPALLRFLQSGLEDRGLEAILASDGRTALDRVVREAPDVVILDLSIPVMDGWRVMERVRDRGRRPRIICLTGKKSRRDRVRAWTTGADEYVTKPFEMTALLDVVRVVADRTPAEQEERKEEALRSLFAAG